MSKLLKPNFFVLYFVILAIFAPFRLLSFDSYYYWEWSRHLAWGYYDGPPLIAFLIKAVTFLFGNNLFALHLVAIGCLAISAILLYKSASLFLNPVSSSIALSLWLFSPLVTLFLLKQTTYDAPLNLFWAVTIFFCCRFIHTNKIKYIYLGAVSIGFLMLSKYSGIVLVLGIISFLLAHYRNLFNQTHIYNAMGLSLLIFSPVLEWNFRHHWISFLYQLQGHAAAHEFHFFRHTIKTVFMVFLPALNFMLFTPLIYWLNKKTITKNKNLSLFTHLCLHLCLSFLGFYFLLTPFTVIRSGWLTPYLLSSVLLAGIWVEISQQHICLLLLISLYFILSFAILLNTNKYWPILNSKNFNAYKSLQQFDQTAFNGSFVLTSGWMEARKLFFLPTKPLVYTLGCGNPQNQYQLWSKNLIKQITGKNLATATYFGGANDEPCLKPYFDFCKKINISSSQPPENAIYIYECNN